MKLRIKGNSLRIRISPSEMTRLLDTGRIEETIHFGADEDARLTYALEHASLAPGISIHWAPQNLAVVIASGEVVRWAVSTEVGLYGEVNTTAGVLDLAVEKDFACLDKSDAEDIDTFPNPRHGKIC